MKRGLTTSSQFRVVQPDESAGATSSRLGVSTIGGSTHEQAGVQLVAHIHSLMRGATMYDAGHPQLVQQARRFVAAVDPIFESLGTDVLELFFLGEHIYVNGSTVRAEERLVEKTDWLLAAMQQIGIAEIQLRRPLKEYDMSELVSQLREFGSSGHKASDLTLETVTANVLRQTDEHEELLAHLRFTTRFPLLQFYAEALSTTRRWAQELHDHVLTDPVAVRRLAARLIDAYASDPSGLLGLLSLRPIAGAFSNRRLDTTIAAIAVVRELGFDDEQTLEMACTSLRRRVPENWVAWWVRPAGDPAAAAREAFSCDTQLEAITSFEAAAPVGLSIPAEYYGRDVQPHAATMVLNVAGAFVDLLQPGDASNPFAPEAAIQMMLAQAGTFFEATIVAALVQALGVWPPGSIVRLNSGDVAVVVHRPRPGAHTNRPFIRPIELGNGEGGVYDLSRPELAAYRIVGAAQRGDCPANPMYSFLQ